MKQGLLAVLMAAILLPSMSAKADIGTYTARVSTDGRTYTLPVVIENDEVTKVIWTDGRRMDVAGGVLHGLKAFAMSYKGGYRFNIEVTDPAYQRDDTANDSSSDSAPDD
jgi:hypothetical protein